MSGDLGKGFFNMEELLKILKKVKAGIDYGKETKLVSDGLLDSLDVMTIVTEVCDEFDVDILPLDIVPENFESVDAIWALITRLQED